MKKSKLKITFTNPNTYDELSEEKFIEKVIEIIVHSVGLDADSI